MHWFTSPKFWMWFHAVMIGKWVLLFPPGMLLWKDNIPFLMYVSLDTALTGALAAFGSALAAQKADQNGPEDT